MFFLQCQPINPIVLSWRLYRKYLYNASLKLRYGYRIYPNCEPVKSLSKLFDCTRVVWNDALAFCQQTWQQGIKALGANELIKQLMAQAKTNPLRGWLSEVSNLPLQQSIREQDVAFRHIWNSLKGTRKGQKMKPPRFKKRCSKQSAKFTSGGFSVKGEKVARLDAHQSRWGTLRDSKRTWRKTIASSQFSSHL